MIAPWGPETTTDEIVASTDLHGRFAVVTGASAGLGAETSRALAAAGARVLMAGRDDARVTAAAARVRGDVPDAAVETGRLDLADLASVRAFADGLLARERRIDLLVNNAGVMATPLGRTADGFELQLGTNHLGHFVLTCRVVPALVAAAPSRIVNLSSAGHLASDVIWDDPNYERRPYDKWEAYGQSKTANILFTVELERRLGPLGVHAYAVHPGMIRTELGRHMSREDAAELAARARAAKRAGGAGMPAMKSVEAGAATTVWAATAADLEGHGGTYLADCRVSDAHAPWALDADGARRLWALSEELVGERFDLGAD